MSLHALTRPACRQPLGFCSLGRPSGGRTDNSSRESSRISPNDSAAAWMARNVTRRRTSGFEMLRAVAWVRATHPSTLQLCATSQGGSMPGPSAAEPRAANRTCWSKVAQKAARSRRSLWRRWHGDGDGGAAPALPDRCSTLGSKKHRGHSLRGLANVLRGYATSLGARTFGGRSRGWGLELAVSRRYSRGLAH